MRNDIRHVVDLEIPAAQCTKTFPFITPSLIKSAVSSNKGSISKPGKSCALTLSYLMFNFDRVGMSEIT